MINNPRIFIGESVSGGTTNNILFVDGGTILAQQTGFTIDSTGLFLNPSYAAGIITGSDVTTTSLTLVSITGLSFPIGANQTWTFEAYLQVSSSTTAGLKLSWSGPTGSNGVAQALSGITGWNYDRMQLSNGAGSVSTAIATVASTFCYSQVSGSVISGSTTGTIQLQFEKVTSGTATVYQYSYLRARRIA